MSDWIEASEGVPFVDLDNDYERNYNRVIAEMDNGNVREMAYVVERGDPEGAWRETSGKKPFGTVLRWMYLPQGLVGRQG